MSKGKVIMSVSGGADSTTLMAYLLDQGYEVHGVWFDYGSKHNPYEMKAIEAVTNYYKVPLTKVDLKTAMQSFKSNLMKSGEEIPEGYYEESNMSLTVVPARNIIFASIATGLAWSVGANAVALGIHAGDHCFTKDTKILTPEGPKTVEELKVGEAIYSVDENGNIMKDKVVDILKKNVVDYVKEIDTTAGKIRLTDEHEVYVVEDNTIQKKKVKDLTNSDTLLMPAKVVPGVIPGSPEPTGDRLQDVAKASIKSIQEVKYGDHVYDISVEKNHNFFAGEWANLLISNSIYPDCRPEFLYPMSTAIWEGTDKKVKLIAPFLFHTKADLIGIGLKLGVPYELTRTCYKEQEKPCGRCGACVERQEAFWLNGTKDPLEYEDDQYWKTVSKAYQEKNG